MAVNRLSFEQLLAEQARYLAEFDSEDPDKRRVAAERLQEITAELARCEAHQPRRTTANNRWPQVDLVALIQQSGCSVHQKTETNWEGDHAVKHDSRSGRCLVVWPADGRWHCTSCKAGGDAACWLMHLEGCDYRTASQQLRAQYVTGWEPPIPFVEYDLPPFPTSTLPDWWQRYVDAEAEATQTPVELPAMLSLAGVAAAVAKKVEVQLRPGWKEPVNLFTVTVLGPANRRTAVLEHVTAPLEQYEREVAERMAPEIARQSEEKRLLEARVQYLRSQAARAKDTDERTSLKEELEELVTEMAMLRVSAVPRLLVDDITPERLASLLAEHGGRMAAFSAEGDLFDLMAGRYSDKPNFGVFLKGHAGDTLRVDRVHRPPEFVNAPALTLGLTVQPDVIQGLVAVKSFRGRGILGRFLYALPRSLLGRRTTDPLPVPPLSSKLTSSMCGAYYTSQVAWTLAGS